VKLHYDYQKEDRLGVFRLSGEKSLEDALEAWGKIGSSILNDGLKSILMFDDSVSHLKPHEVLEVVKHFKKIKFPYNVKVAIVDPRPSSRSNNSFGETVAHNRMWDLISVFKDEVSARTWLGE